MSLCGFILSFFVYLPCFEDEFSVIFCMRCVTTIVHQHLWQAFVQPQLFVCVSGKQLCVHISSSASLATFCACTFFCQHLWQVFVEPHFSASISGMLSCIHNVLVRTYMGERRLSLPDSAPCHR